MAARERKRKRELRDDTDDELESNHNDSFDAHSPSPKRRKKSSSKSSRNSSSSSNKRSRTKSSSSSSSSSSRRRVKSRYKNDKNDINDNNNNNNNNNNKKKNNIEPPIEDTNIINNDINKKKLKHSYQKVIATKCIPGLSIDSDAKLCGKKDYLRVAWTKGVNTGMVQVHNILNDESKTLKDLKKSFDDDVKDKESPKTGLSLISALRWSIEMNGHIPILRELRDQGKNHPKYKLLIKQLTKKKEKDKIDDKIEAAVIDALSRIIKTLKNQKPTKFILDTFYGDIRDSYKRQYTQQQIQNQSAISKLVPLWSHNDLQIITPNYWDSNKTKFEWNVIEQEVHDPALDELDKLCVSYSPTPDEQQNVEELEEPSNVN